MDFLNDMVLFPSAENIVLLKIIIVLMLIIHIPYISILFGGSLFSLVFSIADKREPNTTHLRFSRDVLHFITSNKSAPILLGVLPLLSLVLSFTQLYQGSGFKISQYLLFTSLFAIAGMILLHVFSATFSMRERNFPIHLVLGLAVVGCFKVGYLIFAGTTSLMFSPEKWTFVNTAVPIFVYANELPRHALFLFFFFALASSGILYFFLAWPGRKELDAEYSQFVLKIGAIVGLIFVLLIPIFGVWNLITFPDMAASESVFAIWGIILLLLLITAMLLNSAIKSLNRKLVTSVFVFMLATFSVLMINDQIAAGNASQEREILLAAKSEALHQEILAAREAKSATATAVNGGEIFNNICSACHQFDVRVVGPPYADVLPKYENDKDALIEFILNPVKIDADYPPMPNQNLRKTEATAVADYLMQEYAKRK